MRGERETEGGTERKREWEGERNRSTKEFVNFVNKSSLFTISYKERFFPLLLLFYTESYNRHLI
jgi:hypothetical protein